MKNPAGVTQKGEWFSSVNGKKEMKNDTSPSGNRTLVSRVTGGDTDHYTNEDFL